jgi:hypothetical protein
VKVSSVGLSAAQRRWILLNAVVFAAAVNLAINATIAWQAAGGRSTVPVWASPIPGPSVITDTVLTLLLLPLIACPLVTTAVWNDRRRGALEPLALTGTARVATDRLPRNRTLRGAIFGAAAVVLLAPPAIAIVLALGADHFSASGFIAYKAMFAVALGAIVTPVIALCAMADTPDV